ncbi:hypothetical protein [Burkholderia cenocepacia]|nr:hypothetical protein [Burkholderia cenocepacia]
MQDITGHYAIPLAHPFSDVPPPYGRRRRPYGGGTSENGCASGIA